MLTTLCCFVCGASASPFMVCSRECMSRVIDVAPIPMPKRGEKCSICTDQAIGGVFIQSEEWYRSDPTEDWCRSDPSTKLVCAYHSSVLWTAKEWDNVIGGSLERTEAHIEQLVRLLSELKGGGETDGRDRTEGGSCGCCSGDGPQGR